MCVKVIQLLSATLQQNENVYYKKNAYRNQFTAILNPYWLGLEWHTTSFMNYR